MKLLVIFVLQIAGDINKTRRLYMFSKKVVVSTLLAALIGFTGAVNAQVKLVKTTDGSEITFPEKAFKGTDAEKEFLATGKNIYVGDAEAVKMGKKRYNLWSCTQCHGPTAKGQVGPGLTGPKYNYAKDATNKGMFETIWAGTNGGMGAKGFGLMTADDGVTVDELLKIIAFVRSNGKITGNE
jgi:cytochrome c-L